MHYPQHVCVVSNDLRFREQFKGHFGSIGPTIRLFGGYDDLLDAVIPFGTCLVLDADLARGAFNGDGVSNRARAVMEELSRRTGRSVVVLYTPDPLVQAGRHQFYDGVIQRADQLLPKPVGMDQLAYVLQSQARKSASDRFEVSAHSGLSSEVRTKGRPWRFDPVAMTLIPPAGESFALSASEARLIALLITKDPEPVRRQDLIELFGISSPNIRRIDTTVYRLRHKIEQNTGYESPFSTVHGVGYRNNGLSATVPLQI